MTRTVWGRRLATLCLVLACTAAPIVMVFSTRSLPATLALAALAGLAGLFLEGRLRRQAGVVVAILRARPLLFGAAGALLAWAALSATWSAEPRASLGSALQVAASLAAALAIWVPLSGQRRGPIASALLVGLSVTALLIVAELRFGSPARGLFTDDRNDYFLNRPCLTIVFLGWPTAALLIAEGRRLPAFAIVAAVGVVALSSASQSAALGWLTILLTVGVAAISLPLVAALVTAVATIVLIGMPFVPATIYESFHRSVAPLLPQANIEFRLFVWQGFSQFRAAAPWHGVGFDTTRFAPRLPEAAGITGSLLDPGISLGHPHSLSLQAWVELGWPAVALLVVIVASAVSAAASLPSRSAARIGLAYVAGVVAVASISHGAWQGWWVALILFGGFLVRLSAAPAQGPAAGSVG